MRKILSILMCLIITISSIPVYAENWGLENGIFVNSDGEEIVGALKKGMDVSYHQGTINWKKVAEDDIEFVFIRVGSSKSGLDKCFTDNIKGAMHNNIPIGIYIYSYATTPEAAASEAKFVLENVKQYPIAYPIAFDIEDTSQRDLTTVQLQEIIMAFFSVIEDAGYYPIVYSSKNWLISKIGQLGYDVWAAQYKDICEYPGYCFWQATSKGFVDGIEGNVDLNFQFKIYDVIINKDGVRKIHNNYFYAEDYILKSGWIENDEETYYAHPETKHLMTGLFSVDDDYYLADNTGCIKTGLISYNGNKYYVDKTTKKVVVSRTLSINRKSYTADEKGVLH